MDKITTYIAVLGVVILMFYFGGVIVDTPSSVLLGVLLHPANIESSPFWILALGALSILTSGGIALGFYIAGKPDMAVRVLLIPALLSIGWDIVAIFNSLEALSVLIATILIAPLLVIYLLSLVEWLTGLSS